MAVTFMAGFETAAAAVEGVTLTGTASFSTAQARTGTRSIRCNPTSGNNGYVTPPTAVSTYAHFAMYVATLPSINRSVIGSMAGGYLSAKLTPAGALAVYGGVSLVGTSSAAFATPGWHWVGIRQVTGTSVVFLQIDGVDEVTGTYTITNPMATLGPSDAELSAIDLYLDDVIVDSAGFLAPSKVALLVPIGGSGGGTAPFTGGAGGAATYNAVDNTPPAGLATETDTSQIEHPGGATGDFIADMTTYTTAGINSGDTVLGVQGLIVWGEDSATGTKLLSYDGYTNPVWTGESSIDVSSGHGSGATLNYGSGPPDYWNERRSAILTSPSVTLGTSPRMRVSRPETASRVASVCFMGMLVAWTPADASRAPLPTYNRRVLQSVNRASVY